MNTVVITGTSQGLGLVLANEFSVRDLNVIGTGRSPRPDTLNQKVKYEQFDSSDSTASESFWQQLKGELGEAEVCLINNAGGYVSGGLLETKPEDFEKQMQSVYFTAVYMTRGLAGSFSKAKIINVISSSALIPHPSNGAYGAAKTAEMHFFQSMQKEFPPEQYQISNLYPENIASHGADPEAIDPVDLAKFTIQLAESDTTYYLKDVSLYPLKKQGS
ncbi:MAG: SDR family NAD(P)-dependent oxidoreductase [Candidatus Saccharimonadales bacterium]